MNRRSFFRSLALIGAAATGAPGIFIPKFEAVRWKVIKAHPEPFVELLDADTGIMSRLSANGTWLIIDAPTNYAFKPLNRKIEEFIFFKREKETA